MTRVQFGWSLPSGPPGGMRLNLKLLKTQTFRSGNVLLYYQPNMEGSQCVYS